uniref:Uncharacterized protein n=1 Tax=Meleagris gallopavo TaxID=9103 RepID=A0A803XZ37_MELGA
GNKNKERKEGQAHAHYPEKQLPLPPFRNLLTVRLRCCCKHHRATMLPHKSRQWIMPLQVNLNELTLQFNSSRHHSTCSWPCSSELGHAAGGSVPRPAPCLCHQGT